MPSYLRLLFSPWTPPFHTYLPTLISPGQLSLMGIPAMIHLWESLVSRMPFHSCFLFNIFSSKRADYRRHTVFWLLAYLKMLYYILSLESTWPTIDISLSTLPVWSPSWEAVGNIQLLCATVLIWLISAPNSMNPSASQPKLCPCRDTGK